MRTVCGRAPRCWWAAAWAGGTPEDALLLIDPTRPNAMYVGNHYLHARGIPPARLIFIGAHTFRAVGGRLLILAPQFVKLDHLVQRILRPPVRGAECGIQFLVTLHHQWFGFVVALQSRQAASQPDLRAAGSPVILRQLGPANRKGLAIKRLGGRIVAVLTQDLAQVTECQGDQRVIRAEALLLDRQQLDASVPADATITIEFDVRIESHNFGGYDSWNAYPANVWVVYQDALGDSYTFRRSFYNYVAPGHTPNPEPLAEQLDLGVWAHRTFDLSNLDPPIAQIERVQAGSLGWSYDVAFDNISLHVDTGEPPCPGDLDGDLDVDLSDLATLLGNYGTTGGAGYDDGDLDGDEDVDLVDLAALLAAYGTLCE